ncbi:MAG: hypothetical protein NVS9B10_29120 [Nevskia sp.]
MIRYLAVSLAAAAVAACGGGASPSTAPAATTTTPATTTGTISAFGSVVINGTHYDTSNATFMIDDVAGAQSGLSAGQVVTITGDSDNQGNHHARKVEHDSLLVGPIATLDSTTNTLTALGQKVTVSVNTIYVGAANLAALAVADNIAVSGTRDSAGTIAATYIRKLATAPANVRLLGPVANLNSTTSTFSIGSEVINFATATITPTGATLQNALPVVVIGTLDSTGGTITASKLRIHTDLDGANPGERGELEGIVTRPAQANSFSVGSVVVKYDGNTIFVSGSAADLVNGARVEVHGTLNTDGSLQADRIEVESAPRAGDSRGALIGALTAAPDTTGTPNTIKLLGVTVTVTGHTLLKDRKQDNQAFKLSDLKAGDRVAVAVTLMPATGPGAAPTLTALKIERTDSTRTFSGVSGVFSNVNAAATTLSVETVGVVGQQDCPVPTPGTSGSPPPANPACTAYFIQGQRTTGSAFFQALGNPANASKIVRGLGVFSSTGTLTAQLLDLRADSQSGDESLQQ